MAAKKVNILFITHDTNRAGAQLFLYNIMKDFKKVGYGLRLLCLNKWGPLLEDFQEICEVDELPKGPKFGLKRHERLFKGDQESILSKFIANLYESKQFDLIYANTIASAKGAILTKKILDIPLATHIHELQFSLELYANYKEREMLFEISDHIIACSQAVKDNLVLNIESLSSKTSVIHSFVSNEQVLGIFKSSDKQAIKKEFDIPSNAFLIGACGNAEWRKGLDIFINLVQTATSDRPKAKIHFVWIGLKAEGQYYEQIMYDVKKMGISEHVSFISPTPKAVEIINALDVFTVSSREDPFPLVMLEAALCQKPILGFENTGGCSEFVKDEAGLLANYLDVNGMVQNLFTLIDNPDLAHEKGKNGQKSILENYSFDNSVVKLKDCIQELLLSNK